MMPKKKICYLCKRTITEEEGSEVLDRHTLCSGCVNQYKLENRKACVHCGKLIDYGSEIKLYDGYYHEECAKAVSVEREAYQSLLKYISELFEIEYVLPNMQKQIQEYHNTNGFTYQGMKATLEYFYFVEGNEIPNSPTVGIIPYVYKEARNFYQDLAYKRKHINSMRVHTAENNVVVIQKRIFRDNEDNRRPMIDISALGGEDED